MGGGGLLIASCRRYRRAVFTAVCAANLAILGYYKYAGLLTDLIRRTAHIALPDPEIDLPIGISFFTFQALSYTADVYRGDCDVQKNPFQLALYISFFPQLIAGPIVKYRDVQEQIEHRNLSAQKMEEGIRRFIIGLGKKVLIANAAAGCADGIYALKMQDVTWKLAAMASLCYSIQIYYDFSGYSDMAVGLGKMFGFEFRENFDAPYTSCSIREFWRRWHISLGSWFRDYVYIPLGGSRKGNARTYRNLLIVFFLTGLWHGAGYNYILWGLFHGLLIVLERAGLSKILKKNRGLSWLYAMLAVNTGWILFRNENLSAAAGYIRRLLLPWHYQSGPVLLREYLNNYTASVLCIGVLGAVLTKRIPAVRKAADRFEGSLAELALLCAVLFLCFMSLASDTYNPFIYFQF